MSAAKAAQGPGLFDKITGMAPSDVSLLTRRFYDHVVERRTSADETQALLSECGYENLDAFCADIGMPAHIARRWSRFGISSEMYRVLLHMRDRRQEMRDAVEEFESMTHVGVDDFLRDRGLM
ncbi:MAG TPA: hypothetical protein VFJ18_07015 [Pararhizobium sp.]|jgi:hypothetical protein|nr:hypothetical protein [Pararhizobium sp.]